jgi:hypothetical protein
MDLSHNDPPVVIVPIEGWNLLTEKALRFGLRLSNEVIAVHVILGEDDQDAIRRQWTADVEAPTRAAGLPQPNVVFLESPYRRLFTPLLDYIRNVLQQFPDRLVAVIIPEMVEKHWYDYLLHNHRATVLRFLLMFYGSQRVVVVTVPWYVEPDGTGNPPSAGCITQDASQASGVVCER